ncbi:MAG: VWA domain-containing protein [Terriglobia bacterium]
MRRYLISIFLLVVSGATVPIVAQTFQGGRIHRTVNLVQLDVAVTNKKGSYVTGLRPSNFEIYEDGIREKLATFGEESQGVQGIDSQGRRTASSHGPEAIASGFISHTPAGHAMGRSVFILFDTSNYMYKSFVYAQDSIAEFIRTLNPSDRIAFYGYSRDLSRDALLTPDRSRVLRGVRATVAGDDAALYNGLLLTLEDAARFSGRRVVVVFSNGPDNSSVIAPENVLDLAQSEGVPIYMVCTRKAQLDPVSTAVFNRMSAATGGQAYFSKNWEDEQKAFRSIRDDLAHLYSITYYPQPNQNRGWRKITVRLVGVEHSKKYHIRTRTGYRPETAPPTDAWATLSP